MKTRHLLIVTLSRFLCKIGILKSKTGGMASILYSIFVSSFYQPFRSMISFILNQDFFFWGGGGKGVGKAVQSFSLPSPLKGLPDCKIYSTLSLEKGQPDCKIELISPTAIGCQVHNRLRGKWSWIVSYDSFSFTVTRQTFVQRLYAYTKWYLIF